MSTDTAAHDEIVQFGTFTLESKLFGIDILRMREIIRPVDITKVPCAERSMEGVINLRGVVIPVVSLRTRFGIASRPFDKETRIINVEVADTVIGFIVDSIGHVRRFSIRDIDPPPAVTVSAEAGYVQGIVSSGDELLTVIDVDKLISLDALESFRQL